MASFLCFAGYQGWNCSANFLIMVFIFFAAAILRKQLFSNLLNMEFSIIGATILGEVGFIVSLFLLDQKFALIIGIVTMIIGGIFGSSIFGSFDGGGGDE